MTNTILKYVPKEELKVEPVKAEEVKAPSLTKVRVTKAYEYLKWVGVNPVPLEESEFAGKGYKEIAKEVGILPSQVKQLHKEYIEAKAEVNKVEETK